CSGFDLGVLAVIAICLLAIWPFLTNPALPQATDAELHIFRLAELSRLVRGGELYPRWAPNFYFGYGYPIFNFYAPLTYHLGLVFDFMPVLGPVHAVKILFMIGMLLAGIGMYGFVRDNWGRGAGLVAATAYVYAPFILFVDPYARGDLPESFSFGVFAIALWSLDKLRQRTSWKNWTATVVSISALILTHNLMSMVFFTILFFWSIWQFVIRGNGSLNLALSGALQRLVRYRLLLALICAAAIAAFFWLPVALESDTVNLGTLVGEGGHFDFRNHFLDLAELFGPSKRLDWGASEVDYSLNMGIGQLILGLFGAAALIWKGTKRRKQGVYFLLVLAILIFLMLRQSAPIWDLIPFLPFLQFPWRLLGAAAAALAVLAGVGVSSLLQFVPHRIGAWAAAGIVGLLLLVSMPLINVPPWENDFGETTAGRVLEFELSGRWLGTTSTADFVPATVERLPKPEQALVEAIREGRPPDRVNRITLPASTEVRSESITPLHTLYHTLSDQAFLLRLFQFDFPGWKVTIDGEDVETEIGRPEGFLVVPVPAGDHTVEVRFTNTGERKIAWMVSAAGLIAAATAAWTFAKHRHQQIVTFGDGIQLDGGDDSAIWPSVLAALLLLGVFALLFEPTGIMRYESQDFSVQPAEHAAFADFGDQIALIAYDFEAMDYEPGDRVDINLYWKAMNPVDINYQVFLHMLDESGQIIAQSDKLNPGEFPTKRWPLDKYVRDEHSFIIPDDTESGDYHLSVGLWVASEGWRLPLIDESGEQLGDSFILPNTLSIPDD
ncbi:MAG: hypothetical protein ACK2T3_15670, partial [Candidatus Promineifilaceae bacterium]